MRFDKFSFGSIQIDGITRDFDMVIDGGEIRKRKKQPSKEFPTNLDILPSPSRRAYPGNAGGWLWVPERMEGCR